MNHYKLKRKILNDLKTIAKRMNQLTEALDKLYNDEEKVIKICTKGR